MGPASSTSSDVPGLDSILCPTVRPRAACRSSIRRTERRSRWPTTPRLAGFSITNSSGAGIVANGVGNVLIRDVTVDHAGSPTASRSSTATGSTYFNNVSITNSAGNGLLVNGGTAYLQYIGQISGSQGNDLLIENTGIGGMIDMTQALFPGSGSQGILLQNVSGQVNFNNLLVANTAGPGLVDPGRGRRLPVCRHDGHLRSRRHVGVDPGRRADRRRRKRQRKR